MSPILGMRAVVAWSFFALGVALPTVLLEIRAWNTAGVESGRVRTESFNERVRAAASVRVELDRAATTGQAVLRSVPDEATAEQALAILTEGAAEQRFAVGFVYLAGQLQVVPSSDPAVSENARQELIDEPVLRTMEHRDLPQLSNQGIAYAESETDVLTVRHLASGVQIGWIIDAKTIAHGARDLVPPELQLATAPDEPSAEPFPASSGRVLGRFNEVKTTSAGKRVSRMVTISSAPPKVAIARPSEALTEIALGKVGSAFRFRVVLRDPAQLDFIARGTFRGVFLFSSACVLALVAFAAALFHRARSAQKLADLRTDFVAAVSHELRTPLASVRMFAELLESGAVPAEERAEVEQALAGEARRLHATLDRMLRFGALARGKLAVEKRLQPIAPILEEATKRRDVRLEIEAGAEAAVDAGLLTLAIDNLLSNATKYAPDGGPYVVRARLDEKHLFLDVSDKGPGLDRKAQERVFRPFERADDRLSKATEGSGVGLALVRGIARAHGGDASVTSAPGAGATFTLRLPRA